MKTMELANAEPPTQLEPTMPVASAETTLGACAAYLKEISAFDLSLILILLTAILTGPSQWYIATAVCGSGVAAIIVAPLRHSKRLWLTLTCLVAAYDLLHWYEADNHKYLLAYAMLAVWISLHLRDKQAGMALAARTLLASTFCCALAWKIGASDFASGDFFAWSMLFDRRFNGISERLIGIDPAMQEANQSAMSLLTGQAMHIREGIRATPRVLTAAQLMVMWTLLIEALVALAYLLPSRFGLARWASPLLLVFVVTTYAIAPVLGFGYLLLALGVAVESRLGMRLAFLATFLALRLHTIPWNSVFERTKDYFT